MKLFDKQDYSAKNSRSNETCQFAKQNKNWSTKWLKTEDPTMDNSKEATAASLPSPSFVNSAQIKP
jgi:hypothetical protein